MNKKSILITLICIFVFALCLNVKAAKEAVAVEGGTKQESDNGNSSTNDKEETKKVTCCCSGTTTSFDDGTTCKDNSCSAGQCTFTCCYNGVTSSNVTSCSGKKKSCEAVTISFVKSFSYISDGDSYTLSLNFNPTGAGTQNWTLSSSNGSALSVSTHTITAHNTGNSYSGSNDYASAETSMGPITIYPAWEGPERKKLLDSQGHGVTSDNCGQFDYSKASADENAKNTARENCSSEGGVCHCDFYTRSCGSSIIPSPACYENKNTGFRYWGIYSSSNYVKVADIKTAKECKRDYECPKKVYPAQSDVKTACNGQGQIKGTYKQYCEGPKKNYYNITCNEVIDTKFNGPVLDSSMNENNNAYLFYGTGFKYKYNATSNFSCHGEFDVDYYYAYLDSMLTYYRVICKEEGKTSQERKAQCESFVNEHKKELISDIAGSYYKFDPNYTFKGDVELNDEYQKNNKTMTDSVYTVTLVDNNEAHEAIVCGKLIKDNANVSLDSDGKIHLKNNANATHQQLSNASKFDYAINQYIEKIIPLACLKNGKIVYGQTCTESQKLGSQFFVSDSRDAVGKDYNYTVEAKNLGFSNYGTNSTKCNIVIVDNDIIYRHVDLNDPFIQKTNSGHEIGRNWLNNKYNFTKIVNPNVWSEPKEYKTITLDNNTNKKIKSETSGNTSYYTGACDNNSKSTVCNVLNNSKTNVRRSFISK